MVSFRVVLPPLPSTHHHLLSLHLFFVRFLYKMEASSSSAPTSSFILPGLSTSGLTITLLVERELHLLLLFLLFPSFHADSRSFILRSHPLPILNISEHYTRTRLQQKSENYKSESHAASDSSTKRWRRELELIITSPSPPSSPSPSPLRLHIFCRSHRSAYRNSKRSRS